MADTKHVCVPDYHNGVCFECGEPSKYARRCPECGGPVEFHWACHTYPRTREDGTQQWMSCMPCDSATRYYCVALEDPEDEYSDFGCGWSWTWGLNPNNPRAEENESKNPHWEDE